MWLYVICMICIIMYIYIYMTCVYTCIIYIYIWLYECIPIWHSYRKWIHLKVPLFVVNPNAPFRDGDWHEKKKQFKSQGWSTKIFEDETNCHFGGLSGFIMDFLVYPWFIHGLSMVYYGLTKIVNPKFLAFSVYPPLWVNQWEAKSQGAGFQSGECHHQIGTWLSVLHYLLQNCKGLKNERAIKPSDKNTMKVMIY